MIDQIVGSMVFGRIEEQFVPFSVDSGNETLTNLSYCYMPYSSSGFGCLILKNSSFNELYSVRMRDKMIGEIKNFILKLTHSAPSNFHGIERLLCRNSSSKHH